MKLPRYQKQYRKQTTIHIDGIHVHYLRAPAGNLTNTYAHKSAEGTWAITCNKQNELLFLIFTMEIYQRRTK